VEIFANRGTSGIDGTNGTAVGNALVSEKPTYLLTGDLSFFYDRNAFFHGYSLEKLKIIIFNNQGGGIFRLIGGPSSLPELEQHFETRHSHTAKYTAAEYEMEYFTADDLKSTEESMSLLNKSKGAVILEIFTNPEKNSEVFKQVKAAIAAQISA
jgi:2-succinyl-5-enolpyruvyl-6-hydroxy-3-cyclohexene-1-carboxylate synthase